MKNIKEKITMMFTDHPEIDELHVASNGQGFTNKDAAESHAQTLIDKKVKHCKRSEYVVEPINEDAPEGGSDNLLDQSIAKLTPVISEMELDELEALIPLETEGQKRKGVFELIEARKKELLDALDVTAENVTGGAPEGAGTDTTEANKTE